MKPIQFVVDMNGALYGPFPSADEARVWGQARAGEYIWDVVWSVRNVTPS